MAVKVRSAVDLTATIKKMLAGAEQEIYDEVADIAENIVQESTDKIQKAGDYEGRTGKYRKGFYNKGERGWRKFTFTLANKRYRLTHLLEHGHATRDGGRTKAHPHWKPTQEAIKKKYVAEVKKRLGGRS